VTGELEHFKSQRGQFERMLMEVIWKHRGASIVEKSQDEEWLNRAMGRD
jgi:hypothetical protein